jgi:hypothetical protein
MTNKDRAKGTSKESQATPSASSQPGKEVDPARAALKLAAGFATLLVLTTLLEALLHGTG